MDNLKNWSPVRPAVTAGVRKDTFVCIVRLVAALFCAGNRVRQFVYGVDTAHLFSCPLCVLFGDKSSNEWERRKEEGKVLLLVSFFVAWSLSLQLQLLYRIVPVEWKTPLVIALTLTHPHSLNGFSRFILHPPSRLPMRGGKPPPPPAGAAGRHPAPPRAHHQKTSPKKEEKKRREIEILVGRWRRRRERKPKVTAAAAAAAAATADAISPPEMRERERKRVGGISHR